MTVARRRRCWGCPASCCWRCRSAAGSCAQARPCDRSQHRALCSGALWATTAGGPRLHLRSPSDQPVPTLDEVGEQLAISRAKIRLQSQKAVTAATTQKVDTPDRPRAWSPRHVRARHSASPTALTYNSAPSDMRTLNASPSTSAERGRVGKVDVSQNLAGC